VKTTIPFHLALIENAEFRSGNYDTGLLDRFDFVSAMREMKSE